MNSQRYPIILVWAMCLMAFVSCGQKSQKQRAESIEAKRLLQGVWIDKDTDAPVFQMKGDTVYYADTTSLPVSFKVIDDTLYMGATIRYHIDKQSDHVLWLTGTNAETMKYVKSDETALSKAFKSKTTSIENLTEVVKRDTVVFYQGHRYHIYVAVNPTKYKITRHTINDDGLDVENVYFDNIVHISIFQGENEIFSSDFRKKLYAQKVPEQVMPIAILNNIEFDYADAEGFHFRASVCVPDDASCYLVGHTIDYNGRLTTQLLEY